MAEPTTSLAEMTDFAEAVLLAAGVLPEHSGVIAAVLVFAEARGIASHGLMALGHYVHHIERGGVNLRPTMRVVSEGGAFAVVDADNAPGPVAAVFATELAIAKAAEAGLSMVTVRNSNHFGAGAYYALLGARAGLIGEIYSNVPPMMAPTGGRARVLGNNPLSVAIPAGDRPPLVIDMATSMVAAGRVIGAAAAGTAIPEGWLLDLDGRPTTDPNLYHAGGALVPAGGHKGYGLALAIEALAGALSGAGVATEVTSFRRNPELPTRTGHMIRMTKVEAFMPLDAFGERIAFLAAAMKGSSGTEAGAVLMPGERAEMAAARAAVEGVTLAPTTRQALETLGERYGVAPGSR